MGIQLIFWNQLYSKRTSSSSDDKPGGNSLWAIIKVLNFLYTTKKFATLYEPPLQFFDALRANAVSFSENGS